MNSTLSFKRLFCMLLAVLLFTLPVSAFIIGNSEDLDALSPDPENSEPVSTNNTAPIAKNLEFFTYKNVAIIEELSAFDPEGDLLSFRITKNPARGKVTLSEDGTPTFTYSPYENKSGKDSFTYVAVDSYGNSSEPATVKLKIQKGKTKVTYADMSGNPAHKAAVRLAELDVFVGQKLGDHYFFSPEQAVSREEFLTMAMMALGKDALSDAVTTGFYDDASIAAWAKSSVASALRSGMVTGSVDGEGQVVFDPQSSITYGEASVLVNRLLKLSDVPAKKSALEETATTWFSQPVANLEAVGVVPANGYSNSYTEPLTKDQCALMISGALDVLDFRADSGKFLFFW